MQRAGSLRNRRHHKADEDVAAKAADDEAPAPTTLVDSASASTIGELATSSAAASGVTRGQCDVREGNALRRHWASRYLVIAHGELLCYADAAGRFIGSLAFFDTHTHIYIYIYTRARLSACARHDEPLWFVTLDSDGA